MPRMTVTTDCPLVWDIAHSPVSFSASLRLIREAGIRWWSDSRRLLLQVRNWQDVAQSKILFPGVLRTIASTIATGGSRRDGTESCASSQEAMRRLSNSSNQKSYVT